MAYCVELNLKVTDGKGLLEFLNSQRPEDMKPYQTLENALIEEFSSKNMTFEYVTIDEDNNLDFCCGGIHRSSEWERLAPFVKGYIEWQEGDTYIWRDVFHNGSYTQEYPTYFWPSDVFYIEHWSDQDILDNCPEGVVPTDDQMEEIKKQVSALFDDKSDRNEQIISVIESIIG